LTRWRSRSPGTRAGTGSRTGRRRRPSPAAARATTHARTAARGPTRIRAAGPVPAPRPEALMRSRRRGRRRPGEDPGAGHGSIVSGAPGASPRPRTTSDARDTATNGSALLALQNRDVLHLGRLRPLRLGALQVTSRSGLGAPTAPLAPPRPAAAAAPAGSGHAWTPPIRAAGRLGPEQRAGVAAARLPLRGRCCQPAGGGLVVTRSAASASSRSAASEA